MEKESPPLYVHMGSSKMDVKVCGQMQCLTLSWTCESRGLMLRIVSSIQELLLLIYKSGFYRWE